MKRWAGAQLWRRAGHCNQARFRDQKDLKDGNPVRIRFHSKPEVLALLARHVGLVDKNQEKQEEGGFTLNVRVAPPDPPK